MKLKPALHLGLSTLSIQDCGTVAIRREKNSSRLGVIDKGNRFDDLFYQWLEEQLTEV